jgi:hypothetical protein
MSCPGPAQSVECACSDIALFDVLFAFHISVYDVVNVAFDVVVILFDGAVSVSELEGPDCKGMVSVFDVEGTDCGRDGSDCDVEDSDFKLEDFLSALEVRRAELGVRD